MHTNHLSFCFSRHKLSCILSPLLTVILATVGALALLVTSGVSYKTNNGLVVNTSVGCYAMEELNPNCMHD